MTREEAIKILQYRRNIVSNADAEWCVNEAIALDLALSALRPVSRGQVEKVWRGEWKPIERLWKYSHQWQCSRCGQPTLTDQKQFCDFCGAPMTDEAVDILLKRLEELHDG